MGGPPQIGGFYPQNGWWKSWKTLLIKMDGLGVPLFLETPICDSKPWIVHKIFSPSALALLQDHVNPQGPRHSWYNLSLPSTPVSYIPFFPIWYYPNFKICFKKTAPHHRAWVHVPPFLAMEIRSINVSQKIRPNTLPETNIFAPKNGWLEYFLVSFWGPKRIFSGANLLLVSGSVAGISSQQRQGPTKV